MLGPQQPRPDESGSLTGPQDVRVHRKRLDIFLQLVAEVVPLAGIVHQDDFLEQWSGRPVDDAPYRAQQCAPGFVVEHYHNRGGWQFGRVVFLFAAGLRKED